MPEALKSVAVTGAGGIVGRFVVEDLQQRGIHVRGLSRNPAKLQDFGNPPDWVRGSLEDTQALINLCSGVDALVHCAFEHAPGRYRGGEGDNPARFWSSNLLGTIKLLEASRDNRVGRVVLLSSRAVFGNTSNARRTVEDDSPTHPDTHYGSLKVAMESLARSYTAMYGDTSITSIRPTGVYGLTRPVQQSKWFDYACAALAGRPITDERTATEVHGVDLADAIHRLLTAPSEQVAGRAFNCSDLLVSTREIAQALSERSGSRAPLPAAAAAPDNQMNCAGLAALGWRPGGRQRFENTLDELLRAAAG